MRPWDDGNWPGRAKGTARHLLNQGPVQLDRRSFQEKPKIGIFFKRWQVSLLTLGSLSQSGLGWLCGLAEGCCGAGPDLVGGAWTTVTEAGL